MAHAEKGCQNLNGSAQNNTQWHRTHLLHSIAVLKMLGIERYATTVERTNVCFLQHQSGIPALSRPSNTCAHVDNTTLSTGTMPIQD